MPRHGKKKIKKNTESLECSAEKNRKLVREREKKYLGKMHCFGCAQTLAVIMRPPWWKENKIYIYFFRWNNNENKKKRMQLIKTNIPFLLMRFLLFLTSTLSGRESQDASRTTLDNLFVHILLLFFRGPDFYPTFSFFFQAPLFQPKKNYTAVFFFLSGLPMT